MQAPHKQQRMKLGIALRQVILEKTRDIGRSYRHLARAVGMEPNYISSYLNVSAENWALPKHPTYGALLSELEITEEFLEAKAKELAVSAEPEQGAGSAESEASQ